MIEDYGKGALPDTSDKRDFKVTPEMLGAVTVDWSKEFRQPDPGNEDQGSSDSCVAQAWSYYHHQLHPKDYSRRDLFARIALNYGAEIRAGGKAIVTQGQATRNEVPDPYPQTAQNMRDKSGVTPQAEEDDKELNYFVLPQQDINGVAWGIQNYKGVVFGVQGTNAGWQDMQNPKPPTMGEAVWGHALYGMGFHRHSDGQKCIIAKSSWCNAVKEHHIRENYFITGNTFNAWTLIPKEQQMNPNTVIYKNGSEYHVALKAVSEQGLAELLVQTGNYELIGADGNPDFAKVDKIAHVI
jgi:hypothetical protein